MPELAVHRPFDEPDLHDDLGTNPMAMARQAFAFRERRRLDGQRVETFSEFEQELGVETRADLPGKSEVVTVVVADEQRPEADARSLGICETADDEFLRGFDL